MNILQFLGKLLRIPRFKIFKNIEVCISCYLCNKNCPMQIDIESKELIDDFFKNKREGK